MKGQVTLNKADARASRAPQWRSDQRWPVRTATSGQSSLRYIVLTHHPGILPMCGSDPNRNTSPCPFRREVTRHALWLIRTELSSQRASIPAYSHPLPTPNTMTTQPQPKYRLSLEAPVVHVHKPDAEYPCNFSVPLGVSPLMNLQKPISRFFVPCLDSLVPVSSRFHPIFFLKPSFIETIYGRGQPDTWNLPCI